MNTTKIVITGRPKVRAPLPPQRPTTIRPAKGGGYRRKTRTPRED